MVPGVIISFAITTTPGLNDSKWGFRQTCVDALPSNTQNFVVLWDTNFIAPMERVVQSESIQYNRVWSKDLNFVNLSRNSITH